MEPFRLVLRRILRLWKPHSPCKLSVSPCFYSSDENTAENSCITYPKPHSWDLKFERWKIWLLNARQPIFNFLLNSHGFQQRAPLAALCMTSLWSQLWEHSPLGCTGQHHTRLCQPAPPETPSSLLRHKINYTVFTGNLKLSAQRTKMFNLSFSLRQGISM